ncbi:MAG: hypothetical protein MZW92_03085 [Comamonadaceae bacterium]|nr:hypothetical protein [Comamonadaceae bacterium]
MGLRLPEVRLVLVRRRRQGQERRGAPEALPARCSDILAAPAARHRPQPLPVRHGQRLGVGRRGRRPQLAHGRRPRRLVRGHPGALFRDGFDVYSAQRAPPLRRARGTGTTPTTSCSATSATGRAARRPTPAHAERAVHPRLALGPRRRAAHLQRRHAPASTTSRSACSRNDEVIDVDQDPLGQPGARVVEDRATSRSGCSELEDGSKAVGLFNRGEGLADGHGRVDRPRPLRPAARPRPVAAEGRRRVRRRLRGLRRPPRRRSWSACDLDESGLDLVTRSPIGYSCNRPGAAPAGFSSPLSALMNESK